MINSVWRVHPHGRSLLLQLDPLPSLSRADYTAHAKRVLKTLKPSSPALCVLEAGDFLFYYSIVQNVVYLTLAERSYPKRLAFEYLRELEQAFSAQFGAAVMSFNRPYAAVNFDTQMERIRAQFADPQTPANLQRLASNLLDVHNIMTQNIQEIINRGVKVEGTSTRLPLCVSTWLFCYALLSRLTPPTPRSSPAGLESRSTQMLDDSKVFKKRAQYAHLMVRCCPRLSVV